MSSQLEGVRIKVSDPAALESPEVRRILQEISESLDENPLQKYFPHIQQRSFHEHRVRTKVYVGGVRAGKSTAGVCDDLIQLLDRSMVPDHLLSYKIYEPPCKIRVITPDFGPPLQSVLETFKIWTPPAALRGGSWEKAWKEKTHELHFANGSFVDFLTLEQDVNKFGGVTRNRIHYDEEPKGEKGAEIRWQGVTRLAEVNGDELFTYSPIHGLGWTFDEFEEKKGHEVRQRVWLSEKMVLVKASIHDNPHLSKEGIEEALEKIPEAVRASYEEGDYTHFKGLVYPEFDPEIHVFPEEQFEPEFIHTLDDADSIDPGQVVHATLFGGFDKDGVLWIYDEMKKSGTQAVPENYADYYYDRREEWGVDPKPRYRVADPAIRTRSPDTGRRLDVAYQEAGIPVIYGQNDRETGCFEVMRRFSHVDAEGEPAPLIKISSRCKELIREIGRYRLDPKEDGSFDVVKENDHFCDAMRYMAMLRPLRRRQNLPPAVARVWTPGTAPEWKPPKSPAATGPMGKFS